MANIPGEPALQGQDHFYVTPSDSVDIENQADNTKKYGSCRLYIGTAGSLTVVSAYGVEKTYQNVSGWFPFTVKQVKATGTNASNIVGIV